MDNLTYGVQDAISGGDGGDGGDPDPEQPGWTTGADGLIDYTLSTSATANWVQAHGESSLVSQDGALVMTTADGNENKYNPQYALMADTASPSLSSGELTAVIENNFAGRFCLVFRYQDKDNYAAVGYDWGNWVIKTRIAGTEVTESFSGPDTRGTGEHTVKVTFWDNSVQVDVDGETLYTSSTFLTGAPAEGGLGLRTWGYSGNYAQIKIKSLTYDQTPSPEFDEDGNYMVTFTDDMHRGGWQQDTAATSGWNGLSFTDGEGDAGYMTVSAGPSGTANGNTLFSDLRAPVIDNGFVEMDLTDVGAGGRIGIYFRYTSPDQHVGLMYDTGTWQLRVNGSDVSQLGTYTLNKGQTYHLRIEYVGNNVRLLIDGNEVFDKTLDSVDIGAGRIGLRVWGYETQLGAAKVDNVVNGEFNAVMLDPDQVFLTRSETPYDLAVGLSQTGNAFTGIKVGDTELVKGEDYTYTEGSDVVTLTKAYLAACQESGESRTLAFVFEDGYIAYFTLNVQGEDEENIHYYRSFADGIDGVSRVTGTAGSISNEGDAIRFTGAQNGAIFLDSKSPVLRNAEVEFTFDPANDYGNVAVVLRYAGPDDWLAVGIGGVGGNHTQWYAYTPTGTYALFDNDNDLITENGGNSSGDGQRLYSGRAKPYTIKVRVVESTITVWVDGSEVLQSTIYGLPDSAGQAGILHLPFLIENSLAHYTAVCLASAAASVLLNRFLHCFQKKNACKTGRAWIELDSANLCKNLETLRKRLPTGCELMPAVKANAYGHSAVLTAKVLQQQGVRAFCVACATEGVELRKNGITGEILILGYTHPAQVPLLHRYRLSQTVVDALYAEQLDAAGKKLHVHIKVDTGMHRLGERPECLDAICRIFAKKHLVVDGIFTHLCVSDGATEADREYTCQQAAAFRQVLDALDYRGLDYHKAHLLASYGVLHYPDLAGEYARVGIAIYGLVSSRADADRCPVPLYPVLSLKARVSIVKNLYKGEGAGYGLCYTAPDDRRIAVLSIGYADGLPRGLSGGKGRVLVCGQAAPIIGNICMDQTLVDVTGIPDVQQGDVAVLIGRSGEMEISAYDLAEQAGTITNELLSRLGPRLERILC